MNSRVRPVPSVGSHAPVSPLASVSPLPDRISPLVAEYGDALRGFLQRRLGSADEVEDVLQETWLRLLVYRDAGPLDAPQALVYRVAERVLLNRHRHRVVRHAEAHCAIDEVEVASSAPSQERWLGARQEVHLVREAISALPPKCRRAFLLSRIHRLNYQQIAAEMGISVKMVEKHISHALTVCRDTVGRRQR